MATPAKRGPAPTPPDKGSFPLDHFGDCTPYQAKYLACVKEKQHRSTECKPIMQEYLQCRMKHGLMAQEDLKQLGFRDGDPTEPTAAQASSAASPNAPPRKP